MKQFLLPGELLPGQTLRLAGKDYHYLIDVRHMKPGDTLKCRSPSGQEVTCRIDETGEGEFVLSAIAQGTGAGTESADHSVLPRIGLAQGIPKGQKFDTIVRQAVELGASWILPLACKNSIPDFSERWEIKKQRYLRIIREAAQQSGTLRLTELLDPLNIEGLVSSFPSDAERLGLFLHERVLAKSSLHGYLEGTRSEIVLVVGPEGGLDRREVEILSGSGYGSLYLGESVLRTETAPIAGLAALQLLLRERARWTLAPEHNE